MSKATRAAALSTAATVLRPLASFMLKCGLTWREFAALAKTAFVAAATDEYGIGGRPTNVSRVALLCGLSRKEVRRQRDILEESQVAAPQEKTTDATRVLSAWHQDRAYIDANSRPERLSPQQFNDLCSRYCGEVPASVMLKELVRVGAVDKVGGHQLQVRRRYYMPTNTDPEWMVTAGHYVADMTNSIGHNIDLDNCERSRFLGRATEIRMPVSVAGEFREFLEEEGQSFLEKVDAWLAEHQLPAQDKVAVETVRLGAGVFQIQEVATRNSG